MWAKGLNRLRGTPFKLEYSESLNINYTTSLGGRKTKQIKTYRELQNFTEPGTLKRVIVYAIPCEEALLLF
jgi:hypothetical protein